MRDPVDIKAIEIKALRTFIRNLYKLLPEDPVTGLEVELEQTTLWDIERAEKELSEL